MVRFLPWTRSRILVLILPCLKFGWVQSWWESRSRVVHPRQIQKAFQLQRCWTLSSTRKKKEGFRKGYTKLSLQLEDILETNPIKETKNRPPPQNCNCTLPLNTFLLEIPSLYFLWLHPSGAGGIPMLYRAARSTVAGVGAAASTGAAEVGVAGTTAWTRAGAVVGWAAADAEEAEAADIWDQ